MNLLVLLLVAFPACLAQFSIQGPSDGNRVAQGLRVEEGKGIQYTDPNDETGHSGFTIQGASDSHSNIQGASDGHSNFNIQGATDGGAETYFDGPVAPAYNIQGATVGHSQQIVQNTYNNGPISSKSLEYNDPSGLRVNWRSYDRQSRPESQPAPQYAPAADVQSAPRATPSRHRSRPRPQAQAHPQSQPQPQYIAPAKPLASAPGHIRELLQFQQQIPYANSVDQQFSRLVAAELIKQQQEQVQYQNEQPQYAPAEQPRRPTYRGKPRGPPRERRQAPHQKQQAQRQPQTYVEPKIEYSTNLPANIQQLLKFQAQTPYVNIIPEQFRVNLEESTRSQIQEFQALYRDPVRLAELAQTPPPPAAPARAPAPARGHHRQRRQVPQHHRAQPHPQSIPQEPQPQYSTNLPPQLQQLLKYQAQIPYNIIPNRVNYRIDKQYVPEPVQPREQQVQYQGQNDAHLGQSSASNQVYSSKIIYPQGQPGYGQSSQAVRPVTENQY